MVETVLLASVPCVHLKSALDRDPTAHLAFASDALAIFEDNFQQKIPPGIRVLIFASQPAGAPDLFVPTKASFEGTFLRWRRANDKGQHPDPSLRPISTETDGPVLGFWEIADFKRLSPSDYVPLAKLHSASKKKPFGGSVPRKPMLMTLPG